MDYASIFGLVITFEVAYIAIGAHGSQHRVGAFEVALVGITLAVTIRVVDPHASLYVASSCELQARVRSCDARRASAWAKRAVAEQKASGLTVTGGARSQYATVEFAL